eukprot:COSAG01_NODE_2441_length_7690_cov_241.628903_8_plen_269_part_00
MSHNYHLFVAATKYILICCCAGAPQIIQSDNGSEFKGLAISARDLPNECRAIAVGRAWKYEWHPLGGDVVTSLEQMLPDTIMIHGRVRGSTTQGSVERANRDVQRYLWQACLQHGESRPQDDGKWVIHLRDVNQLMNGKSMKSRGAHSPFEIMFDRAPPCTTGRPATVGGSSRRKACRSASVLKQYTGVRPSSLSAACPYRSTSCHPSTDLSGALPSCSASSMSLSPGRKKLPLPAASAMVSSGIAAASLPALPGAALQTQGFPCGGP